MECFLSSRWLPLWVLHVCDSMYVHMQNLLNVACLSCGCTFQDVHVHTVHVLYTVSIAHQTAHSSILYLGMAQDIYSSITTKEAKYKPVLASANLFLCWLSWGCGFLS